MNVTSNLYCMVSDTDTAPGMTLSSPPGWYASGSDTDSDADMVTHAMPATHTLTSLSDARDTPDCPVAVSLLLKTDIDLLERESASEYIRQLLVFLPSLLDCFSQTDVDDMMQRFASDVCAGKDDDKFVYWGYNDTVVIRYVQ